MSGLNSDSTVLVIDTSTKSTVLGLQVNQRVIDRTTPAINSHSREILPLIHGLVSEAGVALSAIDAFVFGQGPGSFTGLRIAAGVIQGLAYGLNKPVVQVSTMAALAQSSFVDNSVRKVCVALAARLEEVYFGAYAGVDGIAEPVVDERVADVTALPSLEKGDWLLMGNSDRSLDAKIAASTGVSFTERSEQHIPRVDDLLALGFRQLLENNVVDGLNVAPVYLREEVASKPGT